MPQPEVQISRNSSRHRNSHADYWKLTVLTLNDILFWTKPWDPLVIIVGSSTIHKWLVASNILSGIIIFASIIASYDYMVSIIGPLVFPRHITPKQQVEFEIICADIVRYRMNIEKVFISNYHLRTKSPIKHFLTTMTILAGLYWSTTRFDALFWSNFSMTFLLLLPGMVAADVLGKAHNVVSNVMVLVYNDVKETVDNMLAQVTDRFMWCKPDANAN